MGDSCNKNQYMKDHSSTKTHNHLANHHSKSSWSFGWGGDEDVKKVPKAAQEEPKENKIVQDNEQEKIVSKAVDTVPKKKGTSANSYANGDNQNSGNFLSDRPTTKVHAPPGGISQITFG